MNKKYLTILSGNPRGGERTWESLYENVLDTLDSDLAICTGDKWLKNQSFLDIAKFNWIIDEPNDWTTYYEDNFDGTWKEFFLRGRDTGLYSSGLIHFALKDIILKNFSNEILNYDFIIYSRFDQFYLSKHKHFDSEEIWVPEGEDYFGLCDRHAVVPVRYIKQYLNICSYVDSSSALNLIADNLNCEVVYLNQLKDNGLFNHVKRYHRTQFTSALKNDFTNWRIPKYKIYFFSKLMIKYPDEYISSFESISQKKEIIFSKYYLLYLNYLYLKIRRIFGKIKKIGK